MKNEFCDLPQSEINALQISDTFKGFLLSPFQFNKQNGYVQVPEASFKEMIDIITQYALLSHRAEPSWGKMEPSWLVDFMRESSKFDADLVERMLQFAIDAASAAHIPPQAAN